MSNEARPKPRREVAVTVINGFLGAGKTTLILNLLQEIERRQSHLLADQEKGGEGDLDEDAKEYKKEKNGDVSKNDTTPISSPIEGGEINKTDIDKKNSISTAKLNDLGNPKKQNAVSKPKYSIVWLKNEFGVNEVDSLLASQSAIQDVKEILNGCLCCTLVGRLGQAITEILEETAQDCHRIIIETTGYAASAPLVQELNRLRTESNLPIYVDGVVCVVDCLNAEEYQDKSVTAQMQAKYTDLLVMNKHELATPSQIDHVKDFLLEINPDAAMVYSNRGYVSPDLIFGIDRSMLSLSSSNEEVSPKPSSGEVPNQENRLTVLHLEWPTLIQIDKTGNDQADNALQSSKKPNWTVDERQFAPTADELLRKLEVLSKGRSATSNRNASISYDLSAAVSGVCYRIKGIVLLSDESSNDNQNRENEECKFGVRPHLLNWSFGRASITPLDFSLPAIERYFKPTELLVQNHRTWVKNDNANAIVKSATSPNMSSQQLDMVQKHFDKHHGDHQTAYLRFYSRLTLLGDDLTSGRTPFVIAQQFPVRHRAYVSPCAHVTQSLSNCESKPFEPSHKAPKWMWKGADIGILAVLSLGDLDSDISNRLHDCSHYEGEDVHHGRCCD